MFCTMHGDRPYVMGLGTTEHTLISSECIQQAIGSGAQYSIIAFPPSPECPCFVDLAYFKHTKPSSGMCGQFPCTFVAYLRVIRNKNNMDCVYFDARHCGGTRWQSGRVNTAWLWNLRLGHGSVYGERWNQGRMSHCTACLSFHEPGRITAGGHHQWRGPAGNSFQQTKYS